jgi:hypothetical protein
LGAPVGKKGQVFTLFSFGIQDMVLGIILVFNLSSKSNPMENLDITTILLLKALDMELKDLLLADLKIIHAKKAA